MVDHPDNGCIRKLCPDSRDPRRGGCVVELVNQNDVRLRRNEDAQRRPRAASGRRARRISPFRIGDRQLRDAPAQFDLFAIRQTGRLRSHANLVPLVAQRLHELPIVEVPTRGLIQVAEYDQRDTHL
jgi:hypothetical protein